MVTTDEPSALANKEEVLAQLLTADPQRSRDEPEIAANISTQLQHMYPLSLTKKKYS